VHEAEVKRLISSANSKEEFYNHLISKA